MAWEGNWVHWWMEVDTDEEIGIGTFYVWKSVMNNFAALVHGDFILKKIRKKFSKSMVFWERIVEDRTSQFPKTKRLERN